MSLLFALDSFAGAFVQQTWMSYWFLTEWGLNLSVIGQSTTWTIVGVPASPMSLLLLYFRWRSRCLIRRLWPLGHRSSPPYCSHVRLSGDFRSLFKLCVFSISWARHP